MGNIEITALNEDLIDNKDVELSLQEKVIYTRMLNKKLNHSIVMSLDLECPD